MKSIAFLLKQNQPDAIVLCKHLIKELEKQNLGASAFVIASRADDPLGVKVLTKENLPDDLDILVVLGGDGTLLYGARLLGERRAPILGINLGHLGFLSAGSREQAVMLLEAALSGSLPVEERVRLQCQIYRQSNLPIDSESKNFMRLLETGTLLREHMALNDIVLSQPTQARLFELTAYLDGELITTYKADGLIIATPTGSTAYNLAAGGPILLPQMNGMVVTPICPHALTARPLVAPLSSSLTVHQGQHMDRVMLTIDGQPGMVLEPTDFVRISQSPYALRLFRTPRYSFFDVLRTKLHWGSRG